MVYIYKSSAHATHLNGYIDKLNWTNDIRGRIHRYPVYLDAPMNKIFLRLNCIMKKFLSQYFHLSNLFDAV